MSAQVRSSARTVTDATAPGVPPVRASVMCSPRWTAPGRRDRAAAYLDGGEQLLRVARVLDADPPGGTHVVGDVADHVAPRGETDVGVGQGAQVRGGALHRPALDDAAGVEGRYAVGSGPAYVEGASRLDPCPLPECEHLADLRRTVGHADLAPRQSRDHGVLAVGAEDPVDLGELGDAPLPGLPGCGVAGMAAPQREADGHPHQVGDVSPEGLLVHGHRLAWSSALCSDWM